MNCNKKRSGNLGFTLIELIIVIIILGILAAVAIPKYQDLSGEAKAARLYSITAQMYTASTNNFALYQTSLGAQGQAITSTTSCNNLVSDFLAGTGLPSGVTIANSSDLLSISSYKSNNCNLTDGTNTVPITILTTQEVST